MRAQVILGLVFLATPTLARAGDQFLAVGRFEEHGRGVKGHAHVLKRALRAELSQSGAFELVADDAAKREALHRIKRDLASITEDKQWVEVGRAVGATHLILGEVQEDRNTCLAFAQLIHLESQRTKVTLPEYYDCTRSDLVQVAGLLSKQLTGKRASTPRSRAHLIDKQKPTRIVIRDRVAIIDDKRYTFYEGEVVPESKRPAMPPPTAAEETHEAARPAPTTYEPPVETPVEPPAPTPNVSEEPAPWAPPFDLSRWPGLMPSETGYTLHDFARAASRRRELMEGALLVLPFVLLLLGTLVARARQSTGHAILRYGFGISMLAVSAELAIIAFYRWVLSRDILLDADPLFLAAPPAGVALWLIGVRLLRESDAIGFFRQIPWTLLFSGFFLVLLLVASQFQIQLWMLAGVTAVFFVAMRVISQLKKQKNAA